MKHFNRHSFIDLKRMEAELLNKALGATYRPHVSVKNEARVTLDVVAGPCCKGETLVAHGARERRKGGIVQGGEVFMRGEPARGVGIQLRGSGPARVYRNGKLVA
jgi:hypothetical protein